MLLLMQAKANWNALPHSLQNANYEDFTFISLAASIATGYMVLLTR